MGAVKAVVGTIVGAVEAVCTVVGAFNAVEGTVVGAVEAVEGAFEAVVGAVVGAIEAVDVNVDIFKFKLLENTILM